MADVFSGYVPSKRNEHDYWIEPTAQSMLIEEVEAIWSAIDRDDDWSPFHAKVRAIRQMGQALAD